MLILQKIKKHRNGRHTKDIFCDQTYQEGYFTRKPNQK
ncbi:MAG: hypothetical protein Rpha_0969 [Candidatus Ruthia sp. Apha_13_S6]|nr:hypothetical protein [Candidatus Ruthia sp. Apha_13_S6]